MKQCHRFFICLALAVALALMGTLHVAGAADVRERARADENACIATLRTINVAQATFQGGDQTKGFARTLRELGPADAALIDAVTASGRKDGYHFRMTALNKGASSVTHYTITGRPMRRLIKDQRSFYTDETHVIRYTTENRAATVTDPTVDSGSEN